VAVEGSDALRVIRGYATANRVVFTKHAKERASQRASGSAGLQHVLHALRNAATCRVGDKPDSWRSTGPDLDGDDLTAIVVIEGGLIVITVF
jgi:hypothetical protein